MIYLDTHVVVWLGAGEVARLSERARMLIDQHELLISPIVLLEIEFLREIGRIRVDAEQVFGAVSDEIGVVLCEKPFARVVQGATLLHWTRDPFDRLIVAQAAASGGQLLTKDALIHAHYSKAVWQ